MHIGLQTPSATCLERPATNSIYKAQHKHLPWRFCKAIILINQVSFNKAQATKTATCCKPRQATDPGFPLPVPSLCNTCHRLLHKAQEPQVTTALTCLNSSTHCEDRSSSQRHKVTQFYMECQGTILQLLLTKTNYMASVCWEMQIQFSCQLGGATGQKAIEACINLSLLFNQGGIEVLLCEVFVLQALIQLIPSSHA